MLIQSAPDPLQKLAQVGAANHFEAVGDRPESEKDLQLMPGHKTNIPVDVAGVVSCITEVVTPRGPKPVLKAMVTTACEKDCYYCPFRAGRARTKRVTFKPEELARAFDQLQRAKLVDGIFLSSGIIKGGVTTQDKIIDTIEIIRRKYQYRGYVHLKIMPGSERDQLWRAMQLADRVSINLEGPTEERLHALAPKKDLGDDLLVRMQWASEIKQAMTHHDPYQKMASVVTQFVVGAVGDTDLELLSISDQLYRRMGLTRAYYSAFNPVEQTPFEHLEPVSRVRQHRLYQSSFLLRDYEWDVEDLPFEGEGNLPLDTDPKVAYAEANLRDNPIDVQTAARHDLMRVPGIGPKGAKAIEKARRDIHFRELSQLRKLGIAGPERAAPYILLDGKKPPEQLALF